jgi:gliding motility-associated-like protein
VSPANFNAVIIGGVCGSSENYYIYMDNFRIQTANGTASSSTITSTSTIPCGGGNATITFNLPTSCTAPYDVTYTVNGNPFTINNITNGHTITVPVPGPGSTTVILTGVVDNNGCTSTVNSTLTFTPAGSSVNPAWTNPSPICAAAGSINLNSLITGTTGGTWSGTGVSGTTFNPSSGTQTVTYTVGTSPCQETQALVITVSSPDATWTNPTPLCEGGGLINLNSLITGTTGGTWSGTGVTGSNLDPTGLGGSTITVTYTVGASPCTQTLPLNIVINNDDDASFAYVPTTYCITGTNPLPSSITTLGGTFSINNSGVINPSTGEINLASSGIGTYTVYYNTGVLANPCPAMDSIQIIITNGPTAGFSYSGLQFCQDSINPILTLTPGASSGVFSSNPGGLSLNSSNGNVTLNTSLPGVYVVYNIVAAAGGCAAVTDSTTIEVLQVDSALFSYPTQTYCLNDTGLISTITGTTGGSFSISSPGVINPTTGQVNIASTGVGTYTVYYNTAPAGNPCPAVDSLTITVVLQNTISPIVQDTICLGDTLTLTATASGAGTITWYSDYAGTNVIGTGSPLVITPTTIGTHVYYVREDGLCPSDMDSIVVIVRGVTAVINANPTSGPIPLNVFFGNGSSSGSGITYNWDFGTGDTSILFQPNYTYNDEGTFIVVLIVTDGICFATDTITIETVGESSILIPNVFTPNGDGSNDIFTVQGVNLKSVLGEIYNRWGQKMFAWDNVKGHWDGRTLSGSEAPDGTYFYIINAEGLDGEKYFKKGGFSLIR